MKKFIKLFLAALLMIMLSLLLVATVGCKGTKIHYSLSDDKSSYVVIDANIGDDTDIVIPNEYRCKPVKAIGDSAFEYCSNLTSITIPSSVESIGDHAFAGAYFDSTHCVDMNLTSITFEEGSALKSIGDYAFYYCSNLTSITIPNSVESIGEYAFAGINSYYPMKLTSITFEEGSVLKSIESGAFQYCRNLTSITIPSSVESIGSDAFNECNNLTSVTIPGVVASIGNYAFFDCSNLTSITFEEGSVLKSIGYGAFYNCSKLTSITIPSSVESIGSDAFQSCTNLTSITFEEESVLKSIGSQAFSSCSNLTSITIPSSVESIGGNECGGAFSSCYKLVEVCNLSSLTITKGSEDNGYVGYYAKDIYTSKDYTSKLSEDAEGYIIYTNGEGKSLIGYRGDKTELTLPSGITEINQNAFIECNDIASITIPSSVNSIGKSAFAGSYGHPMKLTSIIFEEGSVLKSIGAGAFEYCSKLTSITIPSDVESIGDSAFEDCSNLASIEVEEGNKRYQSTNNCVIETSSKTLIVGCKNSIIPSDGSVTSIGSRAFGGCSNLTSITIPSCVESIGHNAFSRCNNLTSITILSSVEYIGRWAFYYCSNLTSIIIPSSVEYIGDYAFYGCNNLSTLTFEDTNNWYKVYYNNETDWQSKTNGTAVEASMLSDASTNASNFSGNSDYYSYYWYKKDAE